MQNNGSGISTHWMAEYHNPASGPNGPSNPMGNCARCGTSVHHQDLADHHVRKHLSTGPVSHASLSASGKEFGFRKPYSGKHRS